MALPLIVAGIAARAVAKKVATKAAKKAVASKALKAASAKNQSRSIAKNSVKKVSYAEKEAKALEKPKKQFVKEVNQFRDKTTKARKSGKLAAEVAKKKTIPRENLMLPPNKIKINTTAKNSKTTKAKAKANARGLKAANKPIKEKPVKKMNRQELNDSIKKQLSNRREQDKRNYSQK